MNINWFPGHMKKTIEEIENKQKLVDFVIEVVDARIPRSSRNPLFNEIIKKPRLIILNKEDLASPSEIELGLKQLIKQMTERFYIIQIVEIQMSSSKNPKF